MNVSPLASSRRRSTLAAALFAVGLGGCAVFFADGDDTVAVVPASSAVTALASDVADPAPAAAPDAVAPTSVATVDIARGSSAPAAVPADAALADDPLAGVIVEPVDPAEALFGDHAAVAVSN